MNQTTNQAHVDTSGSIIPESAANPARRQGTTPRYNPDLELPDHNPADLIRTAESLLALRSPDGPSQYWPTDKDSDTTFHVCSFEGFQYSLVSLRGGEYSPDDDDSILKVNPGFNQEAILDAIAEILAFAEAHLRDDWKAEPWFSNHYFENDIRRVCRNHLTRLLGRWYEVEAAVGGAK